MKQNENTRSQANNNITAVAADGGQRFTRRIGSTNYRVRVHFSATSTEDMGDKIVRLIKHEAADGREAVR